ncbi:hypothetical protein ACFQ1S_14585, partial [Kibdelosporangium lantanae]
MKLSDVYIHALGVFLPEPVDVRSAVTAGHYDEEVLAESGFEYTHVAKDVAALDMAVAAARQALSRGTIALDAVDY